MNRQNIILVASAAVVTALAMLAVPAIGQLANQAPAPAVNPTRTSVAHNIFGERFMGMAVP